MSTFVPPFCPSPHCHFHRADRDLWRWTRAGYYTRLARPHRIARFRCRHCGRHFSTQTFSTTYWLRHPGRLEPVAHRLVGGSALRQIAREFHASPQSILNLAVRLGRHALLFHLAHRPDGPIAEPLALDSFQSFEFSQYHPTLFHLVAGRTSHFFYGFTDSELRRSGRMTARQKRRRIELELRLGRPDPRSIEREVAAVLGLVAPVEQSLQLHTDEHADYPRALRRVRHLAIEHRTISSRAARTSRNPLFEVNLLDLLVRHCGANHRRETIAFSKRRQAAAERLWWFLVWRNHCKHFSERRRDGTPAMRVGVQVRPLGIGEVLGERLFRSRSALPARWARYYDRDAVTREIPRGDPVRRRFVA